MLKNDSLYLPTITDVNIDLISKAIFKSIGTLRVQIKNKHDHQLL